MSYVLRLMSSCLLCRVSRAWRLARGASPTGVRCAWRAASLCFLAFFTFSAFADALTNCLTYAATFGKVSGGRAIETCAVNGEVEMTATLYASQTSQAPLWCRRVTTDAVDGAFVLNLSDTVGTDVKREVPTKYETLARLFAEESVRAAFWIELSDVSQNGQPLPDAALATLARGKISAAPFALVAERAEQSLGSFTVRGTATVSVLVATDELTVTGRTDFASSVTFDRMANFTDDLTVTGRVSKAAMEDIGTFVAGKLSVSDTLAVGNLFVTNGTATVLKPIAGGFVAPREVAVSETFSCGGGVEAKSSVLASALEVTDDFTIPSYGTLDWAAGGTLTVPDGVYAPENVIASVYGSRSTDTSVPNGTGKNALVSFAVGAYKSATSVRINDSSANEWACYGPYTTDDAGAGITLTTLAPLAPGDTASAKWVLTHSTKELKK